MPVRIPCLHVPLGYPGPKGVLLLLAAVALVFGVSGRATRRKSYLTGLKLRLEA